jgi:hypothetical protein
MFVVMLGLFLTITMSSSSAMAEPIMTQPVLPPAFPAPTEHRALILSPISAIDPIRNEDLDSISGSLRQAGYNVTYLANTAVTLDVLTNQLNNYDIIIWRTGVYEHRHTTYYYVGQLTSPTTQQSYASDFASKRLDSSNGIIGANVDFFRTHIGQASLSNVKLIVLISTMSDAIASILLNAGTKSVIDFTGLFSLQFGIVDNIAGGIFKFLAQGYGVADSVTSTMMPFQNLILRDPLDSLVLPAVVYMGDTTLTITIT